MKFIVGLGNPGKKYQRTRHNVGFLVLDFLTGDPKTRWKKDSALRSWVFRGESVCLLKPQTYVNRAGEALSAIARGYAGTPSRDILVVCDDVNLDFGRLRLRQSGSSGGHHGLQAVIEALGSEEFPRLRIGVRNPRMPRDVVAFVLESFNTREKKALKSVLEKAAVICEAWVREGFQRACDLLSRLASEVRRQKSEDRKRGLIV